ncbi:hypothetical protein INT43_000337 [Umbelopsis isabellina]|uniref:Uncharacterized protein n=1 Tax=Mortierella isabellina TaxID=91625 RepID=A0A8H7Q1Y3_MORIS|nr:hypothetical protein INT43_000337 [Umbelopsis isabellina]
MPAVSISVPEAAAIISAANTVLSATFSLVVVVILLSLVNNKNSVNSWSTIGAMIQNSPWPVLLRTDAVRSLKVQASINAIAKLTLIGTFLTALTGIVTPLGLQDIIIDMGSTLQTMSYVKDDGPMGKVTSPRSKYQESRLCGGWYSDPCPGSTVGQSNGIRSVFTQIAANITSKFNSIDNDGPFNIQYRKYTIKVLNGNNNDELTTVGTLSRMQSFILKDDMMAIEGAVVDTTNNPGIGILQHSFPNEEGESSWSREILWLEPESACVDTNLTVRYQVSSDLVTSLVITKNSTVIVDNGGIANLTTIQPPTYKDNSTFIDLAYHAYTGAIWNNLATMRAFNTTRNSSQIGKIYQIYPEVELDAPFGQLGFRPLGFISLVAEANVTSAFVDETSYTDAYCRGYNATDIQDGTKPLISCALMLGSPRQLDDSTILAVNTTFEQPIYSCASAIRANIQQVNFTMTQPINNSTGFTSLKISRQNTNKSRFWAVEKTGMNISAASPYWGPVDPSHTSDPNLIIEEGNFMYLPPGTSDYGSGWLNEPGISSIWDSQGCSVPGRIFSVLKYGWNDASIHSVNSGFDISGKSDYNLNKLWQNLTASPQNASNVIKLVWTDFMANNVIGTGFPSTATVASRGQSVSYNLHYAIPAFITLALWLPTIVFALILLFTNRVTLHELKNAINQTSIGRSVINMNNPTSDSMANTKEWDKNDGRSKIGIKLEQTDSDASIAKFDYDPIEQPLHQTLQALIPAAKSSLRSRKTAE